MLSTLQTWIREKAKVIESTDELSNDLGGIMVMQRRLSTMERDLAAIEAKVRTCPYHVQIFMGISIKVCTNF